MRAEGQSQTHTQVSRRKHLPEYGAGCPHYSDHNIIENGNKKRMRRLYGKEVGKKQCRRVKERKRIVK